MAGRALDCGGRSWSSPAKALALHLTFVPGVLLAASLAGLAIPPALWVLVLGPFPMATLSFSRLYGFSALPGGERARAQHRRRVALLPLALTLP